MNDDFMKYQILKEEGISPKLAYQLAGKDGLDIPTRIRMLRKVFDLSFLQAKEVSITASEKAKSLNDYQEKLLPELEQIFEDRVDTLP
jgi:hypothetical protein